MKRTCDICGNSYTSKSHNSKACSVSCLKKLHQRNRLRFSRTNHGKFLHSQGTAKRRDIPWRLSEEEYLAIIAVPCAYCENRLGTPVLTCGGLDRIDNTIGYELGNVVSCCAICNRLRSDLLTTDEMKSVAQLLIRLREL